MGFMAKKTAIRDAKRSYLRVRFSEAHEGEIKAAARRLGVTVSAWASERLLRCARREAQAFREETTT